MTAKSKTTPKPADDGTEFPLVLAGEAVTLKANAKGALAVSRAFGGILPAAERVRALDILALGTIVHIGLGRDTTGKAVERTIEAVAESDLVDVATACSGFLARLMTGPAKVAE